MYYEYFRNKNRCSTILGMIWISLCLLVMRLSWVLSNEAFTGGKLTGGGLCLSWDTICSKTHCKPEARVRGSPDARWRKEWWLLLRALLKIVTFTDLLINQKYEETFNQLVTFHIKTMPFSLFLQDGVYLW